MPLDDLAARIIAAAIVPMAAFNARHAPGGVGFATWVFAAATAAQIAAAGDAKLAISAPIVAAALVAKAAWIRLRPTPGMAACRCDACSATRPTCEPAGASDEERERGGAA